MIFEDSSFLSTSPINNNFTILEASLEEETVLSEHGD
jgi:hypothetical protein